MNRKLIRGLLIAVLAVGSLGTVSSCKDTDEDLYNQNRSELLTLKEYMLQQIETEINKLKTEISTCKTECDNARKALEEKLYGDGTSKGDVNDLIERVTTLETRLAKYEENMATLAQMKTDLSNLKDDVSNISGQINNQGGILDRLTALEKIIAIDNLPDDPNNPGQKITLPEIYQTALKAYNQAMENKAILDSLKNIKDFDPTDLENRIKNNTDLINETKGNLEKADSIMNVAIQNLTTQFNTFTTTLAQYQAALEKQLEDMQADIDELKKRVSTVEERLNSMVTGVILQAAENPIFGSFALPINVQSNILLAYYGYSTLPDHSFPGDGFAEYNNADVITAADWARIGQVSGGLYDVVNGEVLTTGNAGRVYVTVNPNNVDFTGKTLTLVNSQDEESGIQLKSLTQSDKVLTFGYTRATNNGFYEAEATLDPEKIESVKVNVTEGLKSTMKDALSSPSRSDFLALIKLVYDQFNGILPANGLKASWVVDNKVYSTYSQYNVAATAFSPLSFKFLAGQSINKTLPTITPLSIPEIDLNNYVNLSDIKVPEISIDGINFTIDFSNIQIDNVGKISVTVTMPKIVNGEVVVDSNDKIVVEEQTIYVDEADLKAFADNLCKQLGDKISEQVKKSLDDAMAQISTKVQEGIDKALRDVMSQLDDKIADLNKTINDQIRSNFSAYVNKLNNYISKVNKVTNKINSMLQNPNHYLQTTLLCYVNDGYAQVSNSRQIPTYAKLAGGDAMLLFPTTYNAEIIVPTFKKYVVVTNVYDENGNDASSDSTCASLMKDANAQDYMNTVTDGGRLTVPFKASKAGYTYEIAYSALDYQGCTSTNKYYVKVVE